ncbi:MAG: response regulator [Bacteroidetes bacterium]|nr:response regulator [Bacteroidota bacterium]
MNVKVKKILLVDDNEKDVELTLSALADTNFANEVEIAEDGVEALDYLYKRGKFADYPKGYPAVILLDIKMPKMDGIEVLKHIRSDPDLKLIPVVMLTSSNEEKDIINSYMLGINSYVVKPVDIVQFIKAIKDLGQYWIVVNEQPSRRLTKKM